MAIYGLPIVLLILVSVAILLTMNRRLRREVSCWRQLERELRDSGQHYQGLVESLSAIVWEMCLEENCFTYISPHVECLLGHPLSEWLLPGFWQRTLHSMGAEYAIHYYMSESRAGRNHSFDYRMLAANGRVVWIRDLVTPIA